MALYQPINVHPYMDTIDLTQDNTFSLQIKGNKCLGYTMNIRNLAGTSIHSVTSVFDSSSYLYNDNILEIIVPSTGVTEAINGQSLKWDINLLADNYTEITHGSVWEFSSPYIYINYNSNIKIGQIFKVNSSVGTISYVGSAYDGTHGWESKIQITGFTPDSSIVGKYYEILASSISNISYYQFNTASTRTLSITNTAILTPYCDFTATTVQTEGVPIKHQKWELYLINGSTEQLINTKEVESENLKYNYNCFIDGKTYKIKLTVIDENNLKTIATSTITCDYTISPTSISDIVATNEDGFIGLNLSTVTLPTNYQYTLVYREDIIDGLSTNFKFIDKIAGVKITEKDYNISNNKTYRYGLIFVGDTVSQCYTNSIASINCNWYIMGLKESIVDGKYYADTDNIWSLKLDVSSGQQKLNMDITTYNTLGEFSRTSKGNSKYISSDLSFKIGNITNGVYYNSAEIIQKWRDFCCNSQLKLLKDRLGQRFIVDLVDTSNQTIDVSVEQINDISFSWTQIGNADLISVVNEV